MQELTVGIFLNLTEILAEQFKDQLATTKAKRLVALTQGIVVLESQAMSSASAQFQRDEAKARTPYQVVSCKP